jgi:AcrR family transcriptional regulator
VLTGDNQRRRVAPLDAALAVVRRDGPDALTMRTVAAEAGVTATALYRHYADKEALVRAVVGEAYRLFRTYLVAELEGDDPLRWLRLGFDRYLRFALEHRNYYRLLFATARSIAIDRYPDDFVEGKSAGFRQLRDAVAEAMSRGVLRADEPADVALSIYAHMHGLITLHFAGRFRDDDTLFTGFFRRSMEHLLTGLR